jgi:molybdopterin-synthase adenylyltransferase
MTITKNEILYKIPEYLPLRDFQNIGDYVVIELGGGELFKKLKLDRQSFEIFKNFLKPHSINKILDNSFLPKEDLINFCDLLISEKIIIEHTDIPNVYSRYDRHLQYYSLNGLCPIATQKKLQQVSVTLIGVGGIGNWIALNLVGLGIKKIRLIDHDVIEESNLTRQVLFSEYDVGQLKVKIAEKELKKRNSSVIIESSTENVNENNIARLIEGTDFVVLSADRPFFVIQKLLNQNCISLNIPLLNVGYAAGDGMMGPLVIPRSSACLDCAGYFKNSNYYFTKSNEAEEFSEHFRAPSFVCLNSLISCMASYEIVKFFLNLGECISINHAIRINPLDFSIQKIYCERNEKCKTCQIS